VSIPRLVRLPIIIQQSADPGRISVGIRTQISNLLGTILRGRGLEQLHKVWTFLDIEGAFP
jgi:hypothetical protein